MSPDLALIEKIGRTCYLSDPKGNPEDFIRKRALKTGHESMLEHSIATVKIITDRGVSHEGVRHRQTHIDDTALFFDNLRVTDIEWDPAVSQESTRYCNYKGGVTFVIPPWVNIEPGEYKGIESFYMNANIADLVWVGQCAVSESAYTSLLTQGWTPQQARSVLPNSTKTTMVLSANWREWRSFLRLRVAPSAHPQMREIAVMIHEEFKARIPVVFEDQYICRGK